MLKKIPALYLQLGLFVLTLFTTTLVGANWVGITHPEDSFWDFFIRGFEYSLPFLGILTIHELGHYFTAKYYKVDVTLPYYIPMYIPFIDLIQIGTMGAFIQMKSRIASKKEIFDIGVAGPLAGFFAALIILFYGFTHLPNPDYIFEIHPEYKVYGASYADSVFTDAFHKQILADKIEAITDSAAKGEATALLKEPTVIFGLGKNLLFLFFENFVVEDKSKLPPIYELYHYPFIFAGYLALFFTALNLFPIGQLDGGHVIYGLFGYKNHKRISTSLFTLYIFVAGIGIFKHNILEVNFFSASYFDMLYFTVLYLYFLYFVLQKTYKDVKTTLMVAVVIFSLQFFSEYSFPTFEGFNGWLAFGVLLGRFLGTEHPQSLIEEPLDLKRKLIGWFALLVFILCFTPNVFIVETLK